MGACGGNISFWQELVCNQDVAIPRITAIVLGVGALLLITWFLDKVDKDGPLTEVFGHLSGLTVAILLLLVFSALFVSNPYLAIGVYVVFVLIFFRDMVERLLATAGVGAGGYLMAYFLLGFDSEKSIIGGFLLGFVAFFLTMNFGGERSSAK